MPLRLERTLMATTQEILKVGIAGLGFGSTEFIPTLERLPQIKLVAGADLRPQAREAFKARFGGNVYESVSELCADPEVEAVWISTPNQFHAEHAIIAAEHGKHMVVRKPLGISMEECRRVLEAVERNGVKLLAGGQTQGTSPLVHRLRQLVTSGELGRLRAVQLLAYTGWMMRPRMPQEVDDSMGGGIVWRQAPHQLETVRYLGGGLIRSVRAMTGRWRPERPSGTGYFTAFLEFEDGIPATITYNGYGFFDSVELTTWGADKGREGRVKFRKALLNKEVDEEAGKESTRFGTKGERIVVVGGLEGRPWLPGNLGIFIVSFDAGDVRMSSKGLFLYDVEGVREIEVNQPGGEGMSLDTEVMELYNAVKHDQPLFHDGQWGMATAEVQWAILESARQRSEILLKYQVPVPQGY